MVKTGSFLQKIEKLPLWTILLFAAVIYLTFTFLGYGSDSDTLAVVRTGQYFVQTLDYLPSRLPGFFVHEAFTYFLNLVGGSFLSNLGTLVMTLLMLASFYRLCNRFKVPQSVLLTFILMLHPVVWVNATSTIDYLWALGFAFYGFNRLLDGKFFSATILFALAIGCRLSTSLLIVFFFLFVFLKFQGDRNKIILSSIFTIFLSFILFIPPLDFLEWDFSRWLVLSTGDPVLWTPLLRIGRFLYKNLMFWGLPALIWMVVMIIVFIKKMSPTTLKEHKAPIILSIAVILAYELLFLMAPIELEYLLPLLPFTLILLRICLPGKDTYFFVFFLFIVTANFIWINPARSTTPNQTSQVVYGLWLDKGYLLQDITTRLAQLMP